MTDKKPNILSATSIIGNDVENTDGENIGEIKEIMIDLDHGNISYAVLEFGGIMGFGDKLFAIPWEALKLKSDEHKFILEVEKEKLEEAEGFDKDDWPQMANYDWLKEVYDFYGYSNYWI